MGATLGGTDMGSIDCRLWGKEKNLARPYPLVCHLVDTAAMAGALWDAWFSAATARRLAGGLGLTVPEARAVICFWAGLHDLGKASPPFQSKVPALYRALVDDGRYGPAEVGEEEQRLHHSEATQWVLTELLGEAGYPVARRASRHVAHQVGQLLGGHHGRFWAALSANEIRSPRTYRPELGSGSWEEQRRAHAGALLRLTGAEAAPQAVLPAEAAVVIAGVVIVADWLASQESFIVPRLPPGEWTASEEAVDAHWASAVSAAPGVVARAGLGRAQFREVDFAEQFGFPPNALQRSLIKDLPGLVHESGSGLLLVTAPPGDGKTEAAWWAASLLARTSGAGGIGFSLPTMATVDAMHARVAGFAGVGLKEAAALTRVHSMSWLSQRAEETSAGAAAEGDRIVSAWAGAAAAGEWLHGGRRGLLAPLSTFTVDQGLAGVLYTRYNALRLAALSDKVLVIDEAHAYGPWMQALLLRLLEWLGAFRAPVVLLSATLTGATARSLVDAYLRGGRASSVAEGEEHAWEPCYPGWVFADGASGQVSTPRQVPSERERELVLEREPVRRDAERESGDHRMAVIRRRLAPVVEQGGCVLVCCTTVAEAQETWQSIAVWLEEERCAGAVGLPSLYLLHSRFRACDRAAATQVCEVSFGKKGPRPSRAILVATQIVEQSLDLDFDMIVSELAPMAMLVQRSGRCLRHRDDKTGKDPHAELRPPWLSSDPRVVVLDPVDEEGRFRQPVSWKTVYDAALLESTSRLVRQRGGAPIRIPDEVQGLVDAVYDETFSALEVETEAQRELLTAAHAERLAEEAVERQLASLVSVPAPKGAGSNLHKLSSTHDPVDEALITTRLGADSARVICAYDQGGGRWTLDEAGQAGVPGWGRTERLSRAEAQQLAQYLIPVPGRWLGDGAEVLDGPESWQQNAVTRHWRILPMRRHEGTWQGKLVPGAATYDAAGLRICQ